MRCRTEPVTLKSLNVWPSLLHVTSGSGSPDTLHVSVKFCPTLTSVSLFGPVVILGGAVENKKRRYNNWLSFIIPGANKKRKWLRQPHEPSSFLQVTQVHKSSHRSIPYVNAAAYFRAKACLNISSKTSPPLKSHDKNRKPGVKFVLEISYFLAKPYSRLWLVFTEYNIIIIQVVRY